MEEQVNIPALLLISDGRTWFITWSGIRLCPLAFIRGALGKSGAISLELCQKVHLSGCANFND